MLMFKSRSPIGHKRVWKLVEFHFLSHGEPLWVPLGTPDFKRQTRLVSALPLLSSMWLLFAVCFLEVCAVLTGWESKDPTQHSDQPKRLGLCVCNYPWNTERHGVCYQAKQPCPGATPVLHALSFRCMLPHAAPSAGSCWRQHRQ